MEDLEGRRIWERLGRRAARSCGKGKNGRQREGALRMEKRGTDQETTVESLATSALNGVVGCPALCGVGAPARLALRLSSAGRGGARSRDSAVDGRGEGESLDRVIGFDGGMGTVGGFGGGGGVAGSGGVTGRGGVGDSERKGHCSKDTVVDGGSASGDAGDTVGIVYREWGTFHSRSWRKRRGCVRESGYAIESAESDLTRGRGGGGLKGDVFSGRWRGR